MHVRAASLVWLILRVFLLACLPQAWGAEAPETLLKAFPGAEVFGACTPGGRERPGAFCHDSRRLCPWQGTAIEESLRAAVSAEGPHYVVFRLGGTIALKADLPFAHPYITIAGQSAPGGGICLKGYQLVFNTHDIIARYLRVRSGDIAFFDPDYPEPFSAGAT